MGDEGEDDDPEDHRWILETDVWALAPRPISSIDGGQQFGDYEEDSLWIIPVVDDRYFWQYMNVDDLSVTTSTTWADLINTLETALGLSSPSIDFDTVDVDYLQPDPIEFSRRRENAAVLLDAVALSVNQRVTRHLDGRVAMRNYTTAKTELGEYVDKEFRLAAGLHFISEPPNDFPRSGLPAKTLMTFPEYIDRILKAGGELQIKEDNAPGDTKGIVPGKKKVVHSSCYANMPVAGGATPDNNSKLTSLATQWSADYYGWTTEQFDLTFVGLFQWKPTGFDDAVMWEFGTPVDGGGGGGRKAQTRAWSLPQNFGVESQLSQDPDLTPLFGEQVGKATLGISMGAAGTVTIYDRDGVTTGLTVTDAIARGTAIAPNVWVTLAPIDDRWHVGCWEQ